MATEQELYQQYLAETGQAQDPLYAQYLAETGQSPAPAPTKPAGPSQEKFTTAESALQGFGSGATLGYLPRAQALVEAALDPELTYAQALPHWQKREAQIQAEDPGAFLAGNLAGAAAIPIPGAGATGNIGARILKAGAAGAGLAGAADTGKDIGSKEDLKSRIDRAMTGGLISGALPGVTGSLQNLGSKLKSYGVLKILGARGKDAEKLFEKNQAGLKKAEAFLDDEGIVGPLTTNAGVARKAGEIADKAGKEIGETYSKVEQEALKALETKTQLIPTKPVAVPTGRKIMKGYDLVDEMVESSPLQVEQVFKGASGSPAAKRAVETRLDPKQMADEFTNKATEEFSGVANGNQIISSLRQQVANLRKAKGGVDGITEFRKSLDDVLKKSYEKPQADLGEKQEAMMFMRKYLKDKTNDHIEALDRLVGSKESAKLRELNDRFSNASTIKRISGKSEMVQARNNLLGLPEMFVGGAIGGAGLASGENKTDSAAKALAGAAAYKLGRNYGPAWSIMAGKALQKVPNVPQRMFINPWTSMTKE